MAQGQRTPPAPAATYRSYEQIVNNHLIPAFGRVPLSQLKPDAINTYMLRKLKEGLSPRSVQYQHAVLRSALQQATRWGIVSRNVARLVTPPRVERPEVRPLTLEEMRHFLSSIEGTRSEALYSLAAGLGLRQSELLGLAWPDVDLEHGTLTIRRSLQRYDGEYHLDEVKSQRSRRTLALPSPLVEALRRQRTVQVAERLKAGPQWQGDEWELVFATEAGAPLSSKAVTRAFKKDLKAAELPEKRFHDLRHGAATYALSLGVPLKVVQDILGHSTIAITADTYSHIANELQRDATDRITEGLWGAPDTGAGG